MGVANWLSTQQLLGVTTPAHSILISKPKLLMQAKGYGKGSIVSCGYTQALSTCTIWVCAATVLITCVNFFRQ